MLAVVGPICSHVKTGPVGEFVMTNAIRTLRCGAGDAAFACPGVQRGGASDRIGLLERGQHPQARRPLEERYDLIVKDIERRDQPPALPRHAAPRG